MSLTSKRFLGGPHTIASAFTDERGEAVLHSRKLTQIVSSTSGLLSLPALSVFPGIPMIAQVATEVALPSDTEVVYELTPTALDSVTVNVLDPEGEPFLESCRTGARWVPTVEVGTNVYGGYHRFAPASEFDRRLAVVRLVPEVGEGTRLPSSSLTT